MTAELTVTIRADATDAIRNLNELRGKLMASAAISEDKDRTADILESAQQANRDAVAAAYRRGRQDANEQYRGDLAREREAANERLHKEYNRGWRAATAVRDTRAAFARQAGYEEGLKAGKGQAHEHYDDGFKAGAESAANQYTRDLAAAIEQFNREAVSLDRLAKAREEGYESGKLATAADQYDQGVRDGRKSLLDDILEDLDQDDNNLGVGTIGEFLVRSLIEALSHKYR